MPRYPHTKLFSDPRRTVVLSGLHIQVLDTHGHILHSTANLAQKDVDALVKSGPIRCSGISKDGRYLATAGDDKRLKLWDLESLTLLSVRELPKKPTSIDFSMSSDILVADKFGDVFKHAFLQNKPAEETISGDTPGHSSGDLLLGHASLLTSCLLTPDEKFIITADRDEHIRVSWYPEGYVIESYCLGHEKYVSAIHIPVASPAVLISGGGDLELKVWDWIAGRLLQNITVFPTVEPFIRVTVPSGKERRVASPRPLDRKPSEGPEITTNPVFVVRRIGSFPSGVENHVVFSVVGATAIFEFALEETPNQPDIRYYDFRRPVIDFTVCEEGIIWALLDADFLDESSAGGDHPPKLVQVVQWSTDKFVEAGNSALLESLNTICSLSATTQDLQALGLYSDLSSLPKTADRDQESPEQQPQTNHETLEEELAGEGASVSVGLTKRALGRLKHKRALGQLHHEMAYGQDTPGLEAKKMKADSDTGSPMQ